MLEEEYEENAVSEREGECEDDEDEEFEEME